MDLLYIFELLIVGAGVGMLSAALGLGGGVLMVPAFLAFVPGMDPHTAKGTSLFIIIFVSLLNAWRMTQGVPDKPWRLAFFMTLGSIVGSYIGAYATSLMPDDVVLIVFILLLAILAVRTLFLEEIEVKPEEVRNRQTLSIIIGLVAGLAGGATGTGGGAVLIPLALMAGVVANSHVVGLSNMVMVCTSIAGTIAHLQAERQYAGDWTVGHIYFALVPLVFIGAQIGSPLGKRLNHHLTLPRRRVAMGAMLLVISCQLLYRLWQG